MGWRHSSLSLWCLHLSHRHSIIQDVCRWSVGWRHPHPPTLASGASASLRASRLAQPKAMSFEQSGDTSQLEPTISPGCLCQSVKGRLSRFACRAVSNLHPHCLRHSCGYALADKGVDLRTIQEWLGHRSIEMTVRYTRISQRRFNGLWR